MQILGWTKKSAVWVMRLNQKNPLYNQGRGTGNKKSLEELLNENGKGKKHTLESTGKNDSPGNLSNVKGPLREIQDRKKKGWAKKGLDRMEFCKSRLPSERSSKKQSA